MKDKSPVDWAAYDTEMAPILEQIAKDIYNGTASEIGRPERVSERIVYRELNLLGHQLENMPQCKAIFEQYTESYPENWARKIVWAYQKLKEEKTTQVFWSDIRKLSGVKKKNIHSILSYLPQYADTDMISQIVTLIDTNQ